MKMASENVMKKRIFCTLERVEIKNLGFVPKANRVLAPPLR